MVHVAPQQQPPPKYYNMTGIITISTIGNDVTSFNLFSNVDDYTSAFETNVLASDINVGYSTNLIPSGTTTVRVMSIGNCSNYIDISL